MTTPTGILTWGQTNSYNAKDDRVVISALSNYAVGIVKPATLAPSTGLTMIVGPFTAIVSAGDGTSIVANCAVTNSITLTAGPGVGSRTDIVWLDIDPDGSSMWTINIRTQADTVGRLGIQLGQVLMPQGANTAAAATMTPAPASWFPFPKVTTMASVSLVRSSPINVNSGANLIIAGGTNGWQSEELGAAATLWNSNGFIVPVAGIYMVAGRCIWGATTNGVFRACSLLKNSNLQSFSETRLPPNLSSAVSYSGSLMPAYPIKCVAGDVLTMQIYQLTTPTAQVPTVQVQMTVCQQS